MRLLSLHGSEKREEKKEPLICKNKERGRKEKRFKQRKHRVNKAGKISEAMN